MLKRSPILNSSTQSWVKTLRLPHSQLPPRPDPTLRPQFIKSCSDDLYAWQAKTRPAGNPFILHDGPPYANGQLHVGHALNKILKDIFNRFQLSQNKRVHYLPGWDCHGLPIELKALQEAGIARGGRDTNAVAIRLAAAKLAAATIEEQKQEFRNWAVMADWENAYKTMDLKFEVEQLEVFRKLVQKGTKYEKCLSMGVLFFREPTVVKFLCNTMRISSIDNPSSGLVSCAIFSVTPVTHPSPAVLCRFPCV